MIKKYHGSGTSIDRFSYEFTNIGNDQLGSGFYFTTSFSEASGYTVGRLNGAVKPGGMLNPTIHEVTLDLKNPMLNTLERTFTMKDIVHIIKQSPVLDQQLTNWGEVEFSGKENLIKEAADAYVYDEPTLAIKVFNELSNDFYPDHAKDFFEVIRDVYGYDGVICHFAEHSHYVAWFPEQIHVVDRISLVALEIEKAQELANQDGSDGRVAYYQTDAVTAETMIHDWIDMDKTHPVFTSGLKLSPDIEASDPNQVVIAFKLDNEFRTEDEGNIIIRSNRSATPLGLVDLSHNRKNRPAI